MLWGERALLLILHIVHLVLILEEFLFLVVYKYSQTPYLNLVKDMPRFFIFGRITDYSDKFSKINGMEDISNVSLNINNFLMK